PPSRYGVPAPVPVMPPSRSGITFTPTPPPPTAVPIKMPAISSAPRARDPGNGQSCAPASAPTVQPPPPATPIGKSNPLLVSLISLAESWPEAVRQELVQLNLVDAKVALPTEVVEQALRQGASLSPGKPCVPGSSPHRCRRSPPMTAACWNCR